ncbi:MAG TPA: heme-binding domain-containing protein [Vicinamibacterales bacterium]|nr:heme-binding domain-containing protein [Vicinamibacterales bacterium]
MPSRRRPLIVLLVIVIVMFAGMQLIRPERTNPPADPGRDIRSHLQVPPDVAAILERSCRDCHSNETKWPWYSAVAPASWLLAYDVRAGRGEMNFSEWGDYEAEEASHLLEEACELTREREMPLRPYTWLHPRARLSDADVERLCAWTESARKEVASREPAEGSGPSQHDTASVP